MPAFAPRVGRCRRRVAATDHDPAVAAFAGDRGLSLSAVVHLERLIGTTARPPAASGMPHQRPADPNPLYT